MLLLVIDMAAPAVLVSLLLAAAACRQDPATLGETPPPLQARLSRGTVGDADFRVMVAELVSAHSCKLLRGRFQPLRGGDRPDVVTGVLWLRQCTSSSNGTRVTLQLSGSGWQWVHETKHAAGGSFSIDQYVRFRMTARVSGEVDVGYDRTSHVASMWFSPNTVAEVKLTMVGDVDVDSEGAWSWVVGAVSSVVASSPEDTAEARATAQGTVELKKQFARGLSLTIDLCTGLSRTGVGHVPGGEMVPAGVGESNQVTVELEPSGMILIGPEDAPEAMTVHVTVSRGTVHMALVCTEDAQTLAQGFMDGKADPPDVRILASKDVSGNATIVASSPNCPVTVLARALRQPDSDSTAVFSWQRSAGEAESAAGGPLIDCR